MGLDMYLYKKSYVKNWEHMKKSELHKISIRRNGKVRTDIKPERISYIIESVGYWRKANAIHAWFVENVQHGEDDCGEYYVDESSLKELLENVNRVLESTTLIKGKVYNGYSFKDGKREDNIVDGKVLADIIVAKKVLPLIEGFFFGGTRYDECYWQDLKDTKKVIEECLTDKNGEYYYSSSW